MKADNDVQDPHQADSIMKIQKELDEVCMILPDGASTYAYID